MNNYWTILRECKITSYFFISLYGIVTLPPLLKLLLIQLKKRLFSLKSRNRRVTAFQLETILPILRPWTKKAKSFLAVSTQQHVQWMVGASYPPSFTERHQDARRMEHSHCQQMLEESSLLTCGRDGDGCGAHKSSMPGSAGGGDAHYGGQKFQWEAFRRDIRKKSFPWGQSSTQGCTATAQPLLLWDFKI